MAETATTTGERAVVTANIDMADAVVVATSHRVDDGRTVLTVSSGAALVTLVLDEHGLRELNRETGPDRSALGDPRLRLVEVEG